MFNNVYVEPVDGLHPVNAYLSLSSLPLPFIISGGSAARRYSYVGASPFLQLTVEEGDTVIKGGGVVERYEDPFSAISSILERFRSRGPSIFPFQGGMVGYLSYDLRLFTENLSSCRPDIGIPAYNLGVYDPIFAYDHRYGRGYIVSRGEPGLSMDVKEFRENLLSGVWKGDLPDFSHTTSSSDEDHLFPLFTSNMAREEYTSAVQAGQEYIAAGDIYQVNITHRLSIECSMDPFSLYQVLLYSSAMPFASFMDFGSFQLICNSPERFLRIRGRDVETCPIKGTRSRGRSSVEDEMMADDLKGDPKELAEHVMVVDLERNDLGKVCETSTVGVMPFCKIETFPGLHHMVSTVRGRLRGDISPITCLKEVFPGGSVTGTPKVRAMEVIEELETVRRGVYTGAIGYIDFSGDMDLTMAIRTAVFKAGLLNLHVGSGIVSDSEPEKEYEETILKAAHFLKAVKSCCSH